MRRWAAAGQLPPRTHVLPSSREGKGLESDGFVHLNSLRAIWQPPREGRDADAPSRRHDYERGGSPRREDDHGRRGRSDSRGRDDSPRPSKLDDITVKAAPQPPATAVQQALWAAAAKAQPGAVSPAEAAHRQREPPKPTADVALHRAATTQWLTWHYELLQIRAANPAPPAFPFLNREILHASVLPVGTPLPRGLRSWTATLLVRYFNLDDSLSLADIEREATVGQHFQIGCALLLSNTSAGGRPPPQPHDATAYYEMARRLAEFMLASQRWSSDEAHAASDHVTFVMRLFEKFPATDVMLYDEDFRTERHRLQDGKWTVPNEPLLRRRVYGRVTERSEAATKAAQSAAASALAAGRAQVDAGSHCLEETGCDADGEASHETDSQAECEADCQADREADPDGETDCQADCEADRDDHAA